MIVPVNLNPVIFPVKIEPVSEKMNIFYHVWQIQATINKMKEKYFFTFCLLEISRLFSLRLD